MQHLHINLDSRYTTSRPTLKWNIYNIISGELLDAAYCNGELTSVVEFKLLKVILPGVIYPADRRVKIAIHEINNGFMHNNIRYQFIGKCTRDSYTSVVNTKMLNYKTILKFEESNNFGIFHTDLNMLNTISMSYYCGETMLDIPKDTYANCDINILAWPIVSVTLNDAIDCDDPFYIAIVTIKANNILLQNISITQISGTNGVLTFMILNIPAPQTPFNKCDIYFEDLRIFNSLIVTTKK